MSDKILPATDVAWPKDISREDSEMFFEAVEIQKKSILRMADRLPATLATCGCRDRIDIPHAINCPESLRELAAALAKAEIRGLREVNADLLAACKEAERHHQGHHSEVGKMLRAVIAKAEGRS